MIQRTISTQPQKLCSRTRSQLRVEFARWGVILALGRDVKSLALKTPSHAALTSTSMVNWMKLTKASNETSTCDILRVHASSVNVFRELPCCGRRKKAAFPLSLLHSRFYRCLSFRSFITATGEHRAGRLFACARLILGLFPDFFEHCNESSHHLFHPLISSDILDMPI